MPDLSAGARAWTLWKPHAHASLCVRVGLEHAHKKIVFAK